MVLGRVGAERRAALVRELGASWPRKRSGHRADGFWKAACRRVRQVEGAITDEYTLSSWWHRLPETVRRGEGAPSPCPPAPARLATGAAGSRA